MKNKLNPININKLPENTRICDIKQYTELYLFSNGLVYNPEKNSLKSFKQTNKPITTEGYAEELIFKISQQDTQQGDKN